MQSIITDKLTIYNETKKELLKRTDCHALENPQFSHGRPASNNHQAPTHQLKI